MRITFILFSFVLMLTACNEKDEIVEYPVCMQSTIDDYLNNYPNPGKEPATITKYIYQNREVYIFDPGSGFADILFTVKDKNCNPICEFGGIAGIQTCTDWNNAKFISIVWEDKR